MAENIDYHLGDGSLTWAFIDGWTTKQKCKLRRKVSFLDQNLHEYMMIIFCVCGFVTNGTKYIILYQVNISYRFIGISVHHFVNIFQ